MPVPVDSKGDGVGKSKKKSHRQQQARSSQLDVDSQLLEAVAQNRLRVVRRLLESGADPSHQGGPNNNSTLMLALGIEGEGQGGEVVFNLLLQKGAAVDAQDEQERTALIHAVMAGQERAVEQLLERGADMTCADMEGNTALSYAAMLEHEEATAIISLLVKVGQERGVDLDHQNLRGLTPLLIAAQAGHLEAAQVLVGGGASLSKRDVEHFMTAQDWMRKTGQFSQQQLDFLSPTKRRRTQYRQERIKKGIKTLSDFLPHIDESGGAESPNVFAVRRCELSDTTSNLPSIPTHSDTSHTHKSMFDILSKKSDETTPPHVPPPSMQKSTSNSIQFSSVAAVKMDLYKSPYLSKRQTLIRRNTRSEGYHAGALAPITSPSHTHSQPPKKSGKLNSKNTKLPPITKK